MRYQYNFVDEIIVDSFAGGGGASTGIELALGRIVDIAINHDLRAVQMHETNHPWTKHFCENIFEVDPVKACAGRKVGLLWASPDCTHFSRAKGGKPVKKEIRGLAWIVCRWAKKVKPRVIILENVPEFLTWGPIDEHGKPIKERAGETFRQFIHELRRWGYEVEWRKLKACDYGAPTSRNRLYIIARRDGQPIAWPKPTHGKGKGLIPYRTAAECIDFSLPCPSVFERKKPLVENTMRRIARGLDKFVIKSGKPFIIPNAAPFVANHQHNNIGNAADESMSTVCGVNKHELIAPILTHYHSATSEGESRGTEVANPMPVIDTSNRHALTIGYMQKAYGGNYKGAGSDLAEPVHTVTAQDHNNLCAAFVQKYYGSGSLNTDAGKPLDTTTTKDRMAITTSHLTVLRNNMDGKSMQEPIPTLTAGGGHMYEVRTHLVRYSGGHYGYWPQIRQMLNDYGNYSLKDDEIILFEIAGELYFMSDIGMRMLVPRELFNAQGFPSDYVIEFDVYGNVYPKTEQVARAGNSVCPPVAQALVAANMAEMVARKPISTMAQLEKALCGA